MAFQIGKAAKLLGMSPEGVRLYERAGILKPWRGESEQSYRTYEHMDFAALIRARGYHHAGFSTKQIAQLLQAKGLEEVVDQYAGRRQALEEEIRFKTMILDELKTLEEVSARANRDLWQITRGESPAMYRFPFMRNGDYCLTGEQEPVLQQWISKTPITFISQSNEWEKLTAGKVQYTAALGIREEQAHSLGLDLRWAEYYPARSALYSIVLEKGNEFHPLVSLKPLLDYVAEHGITVKGNPVSRVFVSINKNENYTRFREVWLPVEG